MDDVWGSLRAQIEAENEVLDDLIQLYRDRGNTIHGACEDVIRVLATLGWSRDRAERRVWGLVEDKG